MKKLTSILIALIAFSTVSAFAGGGSTSVSTNSIKLLGKAEATSFGVRSNSTAFVQGETINSSRNVWFVLNAGTSGSTSPSGIADFIDGSITWRRVLKHKRIGLFITNESTTGTLTIWWNSPVVANEGIILGPGDKLIMTADECPQSAVYAIGSASIITTAMEW